MMTHRSRRRALRPAILALEGRALLSGLSTRWIGQDLHDYVGQAFALGGDGVQDVHVAIDGLPANRAIAWADVQGLGGGDWQYQGAPSTWAVAVERPAGSTTADFYFAAYQVETGRPYSFVLRYDDGTTDSVWVTGGAVDPNLRMPSAAAKLGWIGQDGQDVVGPGPAVGPDGFQDVHLTLSNLLPAVPISALTLTSSAGLAWAYGTNPAGLNNALLTRHPDDSTLGDLWIDPIGDLAGQTLTASIAYTGGKTDRAAVVAGQTNPTLAEPPTGDPSPASRSGLTATWVGQDGQDLIGPGAARITIGGLPSGRTVVAAALSDDQRGLWTYRTAAGATVYFDVNSGPLGFRSSGRSADLSFPPGRDESGSTLTARLIFDDGSSALASVVAGSTDPNRRAPVPATTAVVAHPGDDLNLLANTYGTVHLAAGTYALGQPLILNQPVAILADPGVTLQFSQAASDPAWSTAIKVRAGHITLDGFAVRFATPIRWADGVDYGPAVIGSTDNLDPSPGQLTVGLRLTNLDLRSPPVPDGSDPIEAPQLIRLASALDGTISGNTLKGGTTEVLGGPWTITNNTYLGTVPNTFTWAAFAGRWTHDVVLQGNTASPQGPSGRTWRFLGLTGTGDGDLIADNTVTGIGPRDGDTTDANAAEIILTESYSLQFEGMPTSISADGLILQIPTPQGGPSGTGDVVAILSGPSAGQYRRIAQALGPQTYLLDDPLPAGSYAISIASGFVGETFRGNTVDARGGGAAGDMIFVGNHFGTTIADNHLLGGADGLLATAAPTERPEDWGWSHAPFLGATISGNVFEDNARAATLAVDHSADIKSDAGRVYFSGTLANNTVVWTQTFLAARGAANPPLGLTVGEAGSIDPGELVLSTAGNTATSPAGATAPTLHILSATVDGKAVLDGTRTLYGAAPPPKSPLAPPAGLALVDDTGLSASDRFTTDGRVEFNAVAGAVGYEYEVSGAASYLPASAGAPFLPVGLVQDMNTILVRAIDAQGNRSSPASYQFTLDNVPPVTTVPYLRPSDDTGFSSIDNVTRIVTPSFNVTGDPSDTMILLRDGQEVGRVIGPGVLTEPSPLPDGVYHYSLIRDDAAGNMSTSASVAITIESTPPPAVAGLSVTAAGYASFTPAAPGDRYEYQVGTTGAFVSLLSDTAFTAPAGVAIGVRATDLAGNVGPEMWASSSPTSSAPIATTPAASTPSNPIPTPPAHVLAVHHPRARKTAKAVPHARPHVIAQVHPKRAAHH